MARRIRNVSATKHSARHRPPPRTSAALPDPNRMSLLDGRCIATTHVRDGSKAVFSKVGNDFRSPQQRTCRDYFCMPASCQKATSRPKEIWRTFSCHTEVRK
jgi:hypothetical protein